MKKIIYALGLSVLLMFLFSCSEENDAEQLVVQENGDLVLTSEQLQENMIEVFADFNDYDLVKNLTVKGIISATSWSYASAWEVLCKFRNIESLTFTDQDIIPAHFGIKSVEGWGENIDTYFPKLMKVSLPKVTKIEQGAFQMALQLKEIYLPEVEVLEIWAFNGCKSLQELSFPKLKKLDNMRFADFINLKNVEFPMLTCLPEYTFKGCTSLETVTLSSVETIETRSFNNSSLQHIEVPALTRIGMEAFSGTKLKDVSFSKVRFIGDGALSSCQELQSVTLPVADTVSTNAFFDCRQLKTVDLPSAQYIDKSAFWGTALKTLKLGYAGTVYFNDSYESYFFGSCDLYLGATEYAKADIELNYWNGLYWKSIRPYQK